jgi:hypothetical protein
VRAAGVIPFYSWGSTSAQGAAGFTDAQIAAGAQDAYLTAGALGAKAWGHPFFLRFDFEMTRPAPPKPAAPRPRGARRGSDRAAVLTAPFSDVR